VDAANTADFERRLKQAMYRFACPSPHDLGEYELDLVPPETRTQIAGHVLRCPRCAEDLRHLRTLQADAALQPAPQPSAADSVRQVVRIVATLFEPPLRPAVGFRGAEATPSRTYRADGTTLTIATEPGVTRDQVTVIGLIDQSEAPVDLAGSAARLIAPSGATFIAEIDALRNVVFEDVPQGVYQLELELPQHTIVIEDLQV